MTTQSAPDIRELRPLIEPAAFEIDTSSASSGLIVSPLHVTTSDGSILLTWDGPEASDHALQATDILDSFVATAEKAVSRFPMSSHAYTSLSVALLRKKDISAAQEAILKALSLNPCDRLAQITQADVLFQAGQLSAAAEAYSRLLEVKTLCARATFGLAAAAIRLKDYDQAKKALESALASTSASPELYLMLGVIELECHRTGKAISSLRKAVHLDARNPSFHHTLGVAYAIDKAYAKAIRAFGSALALAPHRRETIHALGWVLLETGDPLKAIQLLAEYVERVDSDDAARILLSRAYRSIGKHVAARGHLRHVLQTPAEPLSIDSRVRLLNAMAESYMHEQLAEEAELALKKAIAIGPTSSPVPYENLGRVYLYYLDRDEAARSILMTAREAFPDAQNTRVLLAISLEAGGYSREAIQELSPFVKDREAESDVYVCLGWLFVKKGDYASAIEVLRGGLDKFSNNLGIINNLAYTYLRLGDFETAATVLASVPRNAELHAELIATFGLLRLWQGNENEGRAFYDKAVLEAAKDSAPNRVRRVRQKQHLEMARFFMRRQDFTQAELEARRGLASRGDFPLSYKSDLERLSKEIEMRQSTGPESFGRKSLTAPTQLHISD